MSRSLPAFLLGVCIFALDQASKVLVLQSLQGGHPVEVIPGFFHLVLVTNPGAAWGILRDQRIWLTALAFGALVFLLFMRRHFTYVSVLSRIAFGLLLGGIAGNLTDRLIYGHVIDFLSFNLMGYPWPAFNVADSAICTGVGLYLLDSFLRKPQAPPSQKVAA